MTSKPGEARLFLKGEAPVPKARKGGPDRQGENQGSTGEAGTLSRGEAETATRNWMATGVSALSLSLGNPSPACCCLPRPTVALLSGAASHGFTGMM